MSREVMGRVVLGVWLGCAASAAAQLPPEIMVDRYLLRAERMMEAKDPKGALELIGKIVALQKEHGLTLPEEFHFKHAQMALSAEAAQDAIDAVSKNLVKAGREGKFYREALELLEEAELLQSWFDPEQTCAGKSRGAECWMEMTGQPGCYVRNPSLAPDATVTWTGECSAGRAEGEGTLKWVWEDGEKTSESTGSLTDGRKHGQWVLRLWDGNVAEGPYVNGKEHGQWVLRSESGEVQKGPYVEGKQQGQWVWQSPTGAVWEGPLVDGKRHGFWMERDGDGGSRAGPYVGGKKHGQWLTRLPEGTEEEGVIFGDELVEEGPYVDGKRHGQWETRWPNGRTLKKGPYVDGIKQGQWVEHQFEYVYEGPYVDGTKHGHWVGRGPDGTVFEEGPYVEGKRRGHWVIHWSSGDVSEGPYADDKRHGKWVSGSPIAGKKNRVRVSVSIYENGDRVRDEGTWTERIKKKK